jgi:benzodiazapine receptor
LSEDSVDLEAMGHVLSVVAAIGVPLAVGVGIGLTVQDDVKGWYKTLKKPSWNPPDWIFGPVWTALYSAMGYASWLVWKNGGGALPLSLYGIQLLMNFAWTPIFFKKHEIGFALLDITALLGVLGATIVQFHKVSPTASYLLLPYLAWTTFATALTADIYKRNPRARGKKSEEARKQVEGAASSVADKAAELADKVQGKDAASKVNDKARDAASKAEEAASQAKGKVDAAAGKAEAEVKKA